MYHVFADFLDWFTDDVCEAMNEVYRMIDNGEVNIRIYREDEDDEDNDCLMYMGEYPL